MNLIFFSNKTSLKSRLSNSFVNLARQLIAIFEMDLSKYVPVVSMNVLMECSRKNWKISTTYFILQAAIPFVKDVIKKSLDKTGCDILSLFCYLLSLKKQLMLFNFCKVVKASLIIFYMGGFSSLIACRHKKSRPAAYHRCIYYYYVLYSAMWVS